MDLERNNLSGAGSTYLRQHAANPIHWQEWGPDIQAHARSLRRPLFVSVGYSSCHWCHVMAAEAFSDADTAAFLNGHFICIKVDREERPDIDHYLMGFLVERTGSGGWPLNVFLTHDMTPVYGLTYAPCARDRGMPTLLEIAEAVQAFLASGREVPAFTPARRMPSPFPSGHIVPALTRTFDREHGGFGSSPKFPPHSTLLYLLYRLSEEEDSVAKEMALRTLDAMRLGGLNDHLGGGVFRYCVDRRWTIPHFEKMLYDQAMALWVFALAFRVLGRDVDRAMAFKIVSCLQADFRRDGLYLNSHDADTVHVEGATYLWERNELETLLGPAGFAAFSEVYDIPEGGNFHGKIHLVRRADTPCGELEAALLDARRKRLQPNADTKVVSGINALAVCALVQASRFLGAPELRDAASVNMRRLIETFWKEGRLARAMSDGNVRRHSFLFDASAALLALTMLAEDDGSWSGVLAEAASYVESFRDADGWVESREPDFIPVPASRYDQPIPSSPSLATLGLARRDLLAGKAPSPIEYGEPHEADFHNLAAMLCDGRCRLLRPKTPSP